MSSAVHLQNVTKSFRTSSAEVMALRGVNLEVQEGELMMLVGPSGCGKTTLISIIAGIMKHDSGECMVLGQDVHRLSSRKLLDFRGKNIGFIFQAYNLLPSLTVAENVAIPLLINGFPQDRAVRAAKEMLDKVGLAARVNDKPNQLSGGQQQRVAIARSLVHQPKLLVCDEPTSALDHETGTTIMELLQQLNRERGTTIIVVTHDSRIFPYATRIAHMDDGHIERIEGAVSTAA